VLLQAQAMTHGADSVANQGNPNFGTKTATVNGNIIQGNINTITVQSDAFYSNGTANLNGNIIQTNATNTGTVTMEATGNTISITNNKVQLGLQSFFLTITSNNPYTTTIKDNEFKGTGPNAFTFTDFSFPGPHTDTVSINLANQTFVFNGQNNLISGFNSITVIGNVSANITGDGNDNILYGSQELQRLSEEQLGARLAAKNLTGLLARFEEGLNTKVTTIGDAVSLGQKQLIAFMRAVLREPEILVLDEATANIDTVTEQLLEQILRELPASTTKVVIAHRLNTIENADQIFFINAGDIALAGSMHDALDLLLHGKRES